MRQIKFRQSIGVGSVGFEGWHYWGFEKDGSFTGPCNLIDPSQQFTGLHDKNGKEIFENDILKCEYEPTCRVVYEPPSFMMTEFIFDDYDKMRFLPFENSIEVLGNIYENPDLLTTPGND